MIGFVNTWNRTETLAPALVGTLARFHGRISDKFERKGRRYVHYVIDVRPRRPELGNVSRWPAAPARGCCPSQTPSGFSAQ